MNAKWKSAIVHLEGATDSVSVYDRIRKDRQMFDLMKSGSITQEQYIKSHNTDGLRDIRYQGTALFVNDNNRRYLITARHVIFDELNSKRLMDECSKEAQSFPDHMKQSIVESGIKDAQNSIFQLIFRVPMLDEILNGQKNEYFLMNLGSGPNDSRGYTYSNPDLDLACISLDNHDPLSLHFANGLEESGYVPIKLSDIANGPDSEGQEVYAIGFPISTSLLGQRSLHAAQEIWSSKHYSLPVSSFGRVSMLHEALYYFWADLSIYPGNSGGPVIAGDRLVGIVSQQAVVPIDDVPDISIRIPFAKIIKSQYIFDLISQQRAKDDALMNLGRT